MNSWELAMDEPEGREPIEVYKAAIGEPDDLIAYLLSDQPINNWMRDALALYLMGELIPPKPRGGQPMKPSTRNVRLFACLLYQDRKREIIKEKGSFYGEAKRLKEEVAENCGIDVETLDQDLRHGKLDLSRMGWTVQERFRDWLIDSHSK